MAFDSSDIKVMEAHELVLKRPDMYWGTSSPNADTVASAVLEQLTILNCDDLIDLKFHSWRVVGSKRNWLPPLEDKSSDEEYFRSAKYFPEAGGVSLRIEFFVNIYAENLFLWKFDNMTSIKGQYDDDIETFMKGNYQGHVAIGFNGNNYLNESTN